MIDAEVPGDARADGVLALDVAARRHHEILGEQAPRGFRGRGRRGTTPPSRAPSFLPRAELVRRDEAAFPQPLAIVLGAGLVGLEAPGGGGFDIQGKAAGGPATGSGWSVSPSTLQTPRCRFL